MKSAIIRYCTHLLIMFAALVLSLPAEAAYVFKIVQAPAAAATLLGGINDSGQVVGQAFSDPDETVLLYNFRYDVTTGAFTVLTPVPGKLTGINDPGVMVGSTFPSSGAVTGFIGSVQGGFTTFYHPLPQENTYARAVSNSGLVTGYAQDDSGVNNVGFIYDPTHGGYIDLPFVGSKLVIAQGINVSGQVIGSVRLPDKGLYSAFPSGTYGFLRDTNGAITLFQVNSVGTRARGINDSGQITGYLVDENGDAKGFVGILPGVSFQPLNMPGAIDTFPQAINNSGQIVGYTDTDGFFASSNKDDCKNGGWQSLSRADGTFFKNQGDCIQYVNTGK